MQMACIFMAQNMNYGNVDGWLQSLWDYWNLLKNTSNLCIKLHVLNEMKENVLIK